MEAAASAPVPPEPERGTFRPDNVWTVPLSCDVMSDDFGDSFWNQWEKTPLCLEKEPWIKPAALRQIAREICFPDITWVERVATMLETGARTGVSGAARLPSRAPNNPNLRDLAPQVLDQLRSWCKEGVMCGPLREEELPLSAKSSPLGAVLKPNNKARLINDQSWPHEDNPDLEGSEPVAFNAGINTDEYPTRQITSAALLRRITEVGKGAHMGKHDMKDAYKVSLKSVKPRIACRNPTITSRSCNLSGKYSADFLLCRAR